MSKQKDKTPSKKVKGASKEPSYVTLNAAASDEKGMEQKSAGMGQTTHGSPKGKHKK